MNTNIMLKAAREIGKQFSSIENMDEDKYREERMNAIARVFDTNGLESEILMYLAEGDGFVYPGENIDFTLVWYEKEGKIKARVFNPGKNYGTVYEFNDNYPIEDIIKSLNCIEKDYYC